MPLRRAGTVPSAASATAPDVAHYAAKSGALRYVRGTSLTSVNPRPVGADQPDVLNCAQVNLGIVMRSAIAATLVIAASAAFAQAQTGAVTGVKPKPVTTVPVRPA